MPIRHNSPPKNMGLTELPLLPFRNPPFWFGFIPEEVSWRPHANSSRKLHAADCCCSPMPANHPITFTLGQFMVLLMLKVPVRKAVGPLILHCWSFLTVIIKLSHYSCGPWTNQSGKLWQHSCRPWTNQSWSSLILGIRPIYKLNRPSFNQSPWLASQEVPGANLPKISEQPNSGP